MAGGGTKCEIGGLEELAQKLNVTVERATEAAKVAVYGQAIALLELVNRKGSVPVDSGRLRASAYVTLPKVIDGKATSEIGYGAPYAAEVHEKKFQTVSHGGFYKAGKGTPGWLRAGVNVHAKSLQFRLHDSLKNALAHGFQVDALVAAGIPTSPHDPGAGIGKYQRKYGFTREQAKALRGLKKSGALVTVRRWKRKKKTG